MSQTLKIDGKIVEREKKNLEKLLKKRELLNGQITIAEENLRVFERFLVTQEQPLPIDETTTPTGIFTNKVARDAYEEIAKDHFKGKAFRERQVRDYANEEGLRVKGKPIYRDYSRTIIRGFLEKDIWEKVDRGLFRHKQPQQRELTHVGS